MRQELTVRFAPDREVVIALPAGSTPPAPEAARRWLDDTFIAEDCEPLRASGKVLTADKLLAVAAALGEGRLQADAALAQALAGAALGALARPTALIDLAAGQVHA